MSPTHDVRAWAQALFRTIDERDTARFMTFIAEDARFLYAEFPPAIGRPAVEAAVAGFFASIEAISHRLDDVWSVPGHVVCRGRVSYTRRDARVATMSFCNVLALAGDRVAEYRIYIDPSPLTAP
jgi:hypothetical protein